MLADKIRELELAVDRAHEAEAALGRIRDEANQEVGTAKATYETIASNAKQRVTEAEQVQREAVQVVDKLRSSVRGFLDDILQTGRVRQ